MTNPGSTFAIIIHITTRGCATATAFTTTTITTTTSTRASARLIAITGNRKSGIYQLSPVVISGSAHLHTICFHVIIGEIGDPLAEASTKVGHDSEHAGSLQEVSIAKIIDKSSILNLSIMLSS